MQALTSITSAAEGLREAGRRNSITALEGLGAFKGTGPEISGSAVYLADGQAAEASAAVSLPATVS